MGLKGHLDLICALDSRGVSVLRHQSFRAPMHLSKPHHDAETLVVNVVNPTAGLLEGDEVDCNVAVEAGARLLLTTPSASRVHSMRSGSARVRQVIHVSVGGFLEFWPELFIPQRAARYSQRNDVHVEGDGELIYFESIAPGRVASGESFAFAELDWETNVKWAGTLVARERYKLTPTSESVRALRTAFPEAYYASGFVLAEKLEGHHVWQRLHELQSKEVWIGSSRLNGKGWAVRIVACGSVVLRRTLQQVRSHLYAALARPAPSLRRAGCA